MYWGSDVCSSELPALVSPGLLALVGDDAPTRAILCAGGGHFARANVTLTEGGYVGGTDTAAADRVVAAWDEIGVRAGEIEPAYGLTQAECERASAGRDRTAMAESGRASCTERVGKAMEMSVVYGELYKNNN